MSIVQISDFGEQNGIQTYRVNGSRESLEKLIAECFDMTEHFVEFPVIEEAYRDQYTTLIKIRVGAKVN